MAKIQTMDEMAKELAENALDNFLYDGKSLREWMRIIASEDCISRKAVEEITWEEPSYTDALNVLTEIRDKIRALPPIQPKEQLRIKARWIRDSKGISHCSKCAQEIFSCQEWFKYCPSCSAEMSEDKE